MPHTKSCACCGTRNLPACTPVIRFAVCNSHTLCAVTFYPVHNRYSTEVKRALDVLDKQLEGKSFLCGEDFTIADIAWLPWVR